ncbi:hypothetical protein QCA50_000696 [Cerrena zonata]|uniref:Uncharacterized protein n=1 Tax=Cerrena zonata TaxID=2478898 RepID=A0AAW0H016_9APHY
MPLEAHRLKSIYACLTSASTALEDEAWLAKVAPQEMALYRLIPETRVGIPQPNSPGYHKLAAIIQIGLLMRLNALFTCSEINYQKYRLELKYFIFLQFKSAKSFEKSPAVSLFRQGLNLFISPSIPSISQLLKPLAKTILTSTSSRRIDPDNFADHLIFLTERNLSVQDKEALEGDLPKLKNVFLRYLNGVGHPEHPHLADLKILINDDERYNEDNRDPLYRMKRVAQTMTGQMLMPTRTSPLQIILTKTIPDRHTGNRGPIQDMLIIPKIHACFHQMLIFHTSRLHDMLNDNANLLSDSATDLDVFFHQVFVGLDEDFFNLNA